MSCYETSDMSSVETNDGTAWPYIHVCRWKGTKKSICTRGCVGSLFLGVTPVPFFRNMSHKCFWRVCAPWNKQNA